VGPADRWRSLSSLYHRSSVFSRVLVFPIAIRLVRDSSPSGPSLFVGDREVGLRPLPTAVVSCLLVAGMSRLDGIGEGAQLDVLFPSPLIRAFRFPLPSRITTLRTRRYPCSSVVGSRVEVFR
jgi:hypothetical protein